MRRKRKSLSTFIRCVKRMKSAMSFKTKFVTSSKNPIKSKKHSSLMSTNKSYRRFPKTSIPNTLRNATNICLRCHFLTHSTKRPFSVLLRLCAGESLILMKSSSAKGKWRTLRYCNEGQLDWFAKETSHC